MVLGLFFVLFTNAFLRVRRELAVFDEDMRHDHEVLAQVLRTSVTAIWKSQGRHAALDLLERSTLRSGMVQLRWIDGTPGPPSQATDRLTTDVPILIDGTLMGLVEISESRSFATSYARRTLIRTLILTIIAVVAAAVLSTFLGIWFVGKPMSKLVDKARRIGSGDLQEPLVIRQRDEIGELAAEMNAMCLCFLEICYVLNAEIEVWLWV